MNFKTELDNVYEKIQTVKEGLSMFLWRVCPFRIIYIYKNKFESFVTTDEGPGSKLALREGGSRRNIES